MAKLECELVGDFSVILRDIEDGILNGSASASLEDRSVFERYSMAGGNRLSMSVTLFGPPERIRLSAITAGGSSAIFFKINTFGEEAFLECIEEIVSPYCH